MDWELVIKVATIVVGGLTLLDKGYELIKKRRAQTRVYRRPTKAPNFLRFLKKKLFGISLYGKDLVLMSNFMAPMLLKKVFSKNA